MISGYDGKNTVNTIQTYNFEDSMQVMRDDKCLELGISSLYTFESTHSDYIVAQDACADIMIHYNKDKSELGADLVGPHDNLDKLELCEGHRYWGIRFLPGYSPVVTGESITDIKGFIVDMREGDLYNKLIDAVCGQDTFDQQCQAVLQCLDTAQAAHPDWIENSQSELAKWILDTIIRDKRKLSLAELEKASGYSARYLNKVFRMYTGYTISCFSNIMRAQRVGEYLCWCKIQGLKPGYTDIACVLNYTDQAHMIHEFEKHFGMAPMQFFKTYGPVPGPVPDTCWSGA